MDLGPVYIEEHYKASQHADIAYELQKLYPDVKIPTSQYTGYFLNQLRSSPQYAGLDEVVSQVLDLCQQEGVIKPGKQDYDLQAYKMRYLGKFKALFEEKGWTKALNDYDMKSVKPLVKKTFEPKEDICYISIDLRAANFETLNYFFKLGALSWDNFVQQHFPEMHIALRQSKSFRQMLFGNINPGRTNSLTGSLTALYVEMLTVAGWNIVSINTDEIIVDSGDAPLDEAVAELSELSWDLVPVKFKIFAVASKDDDGSPIRVDTVMVVNNSLFETSYMRLFGVAGNRFFRNFATHVLGKDHEWQDNVFEVDGRLAHWV